MKQPRIPNFVKPPSEYRGHKTAAVLLFAMGAIGVWNDVSVRSQTHRQPVPAGSCLSPFFETQHEGDPGANDLTPFLGNRTGLALHVATKEPAVGVRAAFKSPGDDQWVAVSDMLPVGASGDTTLTVAIGKRAVTFGVQVVTDKDAANCWEIPTVVVETQGVGVYRSHPGQSPWQNPGEHITNAGL